MGRKSRMKKEKRNIEIKTDNREKESPMTGRLLGYGLATILTVGGVGLLYREGCLSLPSVSRQEADAVLRDFPEHIPGAQEVRKFGYDGSRQLLVNVKVSHPITKEQMKWSEEIDEVLKNRGRNVSRIRSFEEINQEVVAVFGDVSKIIKYIADRYRLDSVYSEGLTSDVEVKINDAIRRIAKIYPVPETIPGIFDTSDSVQAYMILRSTLNGVLTARAAEKYETHTLDADSYEARAKAFREGQSEEDFLKGYNIINGKREDAALDLIAERGDRIAVLVYGGIHNFKDNIEEWNGRYRDRKFSLVEIDPSSLKRLETTRFR